MKPTLRLRGGRVQAPRSDNAKYREYELRKREFLRDNPILTAKEYEVAIRRIARELGV